VSRRDGTPNDMAAVPFPVTGREVRFRSRLVGDFNAPTGERGFTDIARRIARVPGHTIVAVPAADVRRFNSLHRRGSGTQHRRRRVEERDDDAGDPNRVTSHTSLLMPDRSGLAREASCKADASGCRLIPNRGRGSFHCD
jgi:hypothetical protein